MESDASQQRHGCDENQRPLEAHNETQVRLVQIREALSIKFKNSLQGMEQTPVEEKIKQKKQAVSH